MENYKVYNNNHQIKNNTSLSSFLSVTKKKQKVNRPTKDNKQSGTFSKQPRQPKQPTQPKHKKQPKQPQQPKQPKQPQQPDKTQIVSAQKQGTAKAKCHLESINKKFINLLMKNGEKCKALVLFTQCLNLLEKKTLLFKNQKNHYAGEHTVDNNKHIIPSNNTVQLHNFLKAFNTREKKESFEKNKRLIHTSGEHIKKSSQIQNNHNKQLFLYNNIKRAIKSYTENSCNNFLKNNILYQAIENVKPPLELRKVRKGGTTYQVPAIVSQKKQERLAIKWIIESACSKKNKQKKSFPESLVVQILEAFNKTGTVRQKRDEMLKIAEFNRAYTRYRWW